MPKKQASPARNFLKSLVPPILTRQNSMDFGKLVPWNRQSRVLGMDNMTEVAMSDEDFYKGYLYSAIRTRANRTAQFATSYLQTVVNKNGSDDPESDVPHPFLLAIDESPTFQNYWFWKALSTFIDLKGVAYVMALRNFDPASGRIGDVQEFKVLNPYNIKRVVNASTGELGGYIEWKGAMQRTIAPQMMIEFKELNPFKLDEGFAMVRAAEDDQFLSRQSGNFTRKALKNNTTQKRGLLTTEVLLSDEEFANFKARVKNEDGDLLFGNGPGSLSYVDMSIDLDKLALDKINEISREGLIAVTGASKTILAIEMSGVTRESGRVQKELFLENQIIPQTQLIIDTFNQDYRNSYNSDYKQNRLEIRIDNPLKVDRESDKVAAEVQKTKAETASTLVKAGYDPSMALEVAGIETEMDWVGIPAGATATNSDGSGSVNSNQNKNTSSINADKDKHSAGPELKLNAFDDAVKTVALAKQTSLEQDLQTIQARTLQAAIRKISGNELTQQQADEVISRSDRNELEKEIEVALSSFYLALLTLFGTGFIKQRFKQFGKQATFKLNNDVKGYIKQHAQKAAKSHMDTILKDIYTTAQEAAKEGLSREQTTRKLVNKYNDNISKNRAKTIARTETNRTVAEAQYAADKQFLKQNGIEEHAYKRWITRSGNPCNYCETLEKQTKANPIPFDQHFVKLNEGVTAEVETKDGTSQKTYVAGYEPIDSGTLHPNCSCIYELIIVKG